MPEKAILQPEEITAEQVMEERNAEVRRSLIEIMGKERFLFLSKAEEISRDEYGILYRKDFADGEPWLAVMVTNTTPNPDGSKGKEYLHQIHPECRPIFADNSFGNPQELTARNAIASTFGEYGEDYMVLDGVY